MLTIVFIGAGSTVFVKNILGDIFLNPDIPKNIHIVLYDIDGSRLEESRLIAETLNMQFGDSEATISVYLGLKNRKQALRNADFVINTIQVGGYDPATIADFEIPKKYGLNQTIGDTLGIGGIFRGLRTLPVMWDIANDLTQVAPHALFLNYTNPMAIVTGSLTNYTDIATVGLCHSVQVCAQHLLEGVDLQVANPRWTIAGINHMAWLLEIKDGNLDLYPEIKKRAAEKNALALGNPSKRHKDMVRFEILRRFGYYVTESSEHNAEYTPFWIKSKYPELIENYQIPLDEYPRRCITQIDEWDHQKKNILESNNLAHTVSNEYGAPIIAAVFNDKPDRIHGNVKNNGLIENLPDDAIVEVPILIDSNRLNPCRVGKLPTQCAALNTTNINVQLLTLEAAWTKDREKVYQAAMLDPRTGSELTIDEIVKLCDELLIAHKQWLPEYN